jgi:hypothetical protein
MAFAREGGGFTTVQVSLGPSVRVYSRFAAAKYREPVLTIRWTVAMSGNPLSSDRGCSFSRV